MTAYRYAWARYMGQPSCRGRKGMACQVVVRSPRNAALGIRDNNSALVEFEDGFLAVVSRNALRRAR